MCVISICPKGTEKYSEEVLKFIEMGFNNNRQGSGYMFKRHNDTFVHVKKGFFVLQDLMDSINNESLQVEDELVIHHRIGNVGSINKENTHPFIISKNHIEIIKEDVRSDKPALVHNGTFKNITLYNNLDKDYSDTYAFSRYIISNKNVMNLLLEDQELFENTFEPILNSSRICILFPDRDLIKLGKFIEDNGYFHSNEGYCKSNVFNRGGNQYWWEEEWEYDNYGGRKTINNEIKNPIVTSNNSLNASIKNDTSVGVNNGFKSIFLDETMVTLDKYNHKHFWVCEKSMVKNPKPKYIYKSIENYDPDTYSIYTTLKSYREGISDAILTGVPTEKLLKEYYYIPKPSHYKVYKEFKELIDIQEPVGKNTFKKLEYLLNKKMNTFKKNDEQIFYHKIGLFRTKQALIMYKNYLKSFVLIKHFEPDEPVDMSFSD